MNVFKKILSLKNHIQQIIQIDKIKMIVNLSQPFKNKYYNFRVSQTPVKQRKKDPTSTRSHKSFVKDKKKLNIMMDINKKYQQELINSQFYKLRQLEKYSPKKFSKIQQEKSFQNLSPIKLNKGTSSKQKYENKKKNSDSTKSLSQDQNFTLFGQKFTQKRIIQNQSSIPQIPESQIQISKIVEDSWLKNPDDPVIGYWIPQNKLITLFPVNNRKIDKVPVINQPYILPMLGCLTVRHSDRKTQKYIVTELFKKNSLRDVLNEFGNLDEETVKSYLRKIIICVWNLHKNRISHNRLSLDSFLCAQNGDLLLNMLKSSIKPLTQKQKFKDTYNFPPQMLLSRTNYDSLKNDIWSIGCIALELLTNYDHRNNAYHPYNQVIQTNGDQSPTKFSTAQIPRNGKAFRFLTSFEVSRISSQFNLLKDSTNILQKVRRLIQTDSPLATNQSLVCIDLCQSIILKELSPLAVDFIKKCLHIKLQKRPSIDELMFHSFLK